MDFVKARVMRFLKKIYKESGNHMKKLKCIVDELMKKYGENCFKYP